MAKVLLIEDDKTQAEVYLTRLLGEGYSATWAKDGEQGLKMALENQPSLILLDIKMPKMDGLSVMAELRKDEWGKKVPIIILTNLDPNDEILSHITKDSPSYFLFKPSTDPEEIIDKINETLENPPHTEIT
ncbi:MAG: response regulator [Candidatus Levybacteria bacterium]|nr:response regulator [Candidatus Levybacteria bacterium]